MPLAPCSLPLFSPPTVPSSAHGRNNRRRQTQDHCPGSTAPGDPARLPCCEENPSSRYIGIYDTFHRHRGGGLSLEIEEELAFSSSLTTAPLPLPLMRRGAIGKPHLKHTDYFLPQGFFIPHGFLAHGFFLPHGCLIPHGFTGSPPFACVWI